MITATIEELRELGLTEDWSEDDNALGSYLSMKLGDVCLFARRVGEGAYAFIPRTINQGVKSRFSNDDLAFYASRGAVNAKSFIAMLRGSGSVAKPYSELTQDFRETLYKIARADFDEPADDLVETALKYSKSYTPAARALAEIEVEAAIIAHRDGNPERFFHPDRYNKKGDINQFFSFNRYRGL